MLKNPDYCVSAWRDADGNIPEPGTKVSLPSFEEGLFTFVDQEREPLVRRELEWYERCWDEHPENRPDNYGMELQEDPPTCATCGVACHYGYRQFWKHTPVGDGVTGEYPRDAEPKCESVLVRSLCMDCAYDEDKQTYRDDQKLTTSLSEQWLQLPLHFVP